MSEPRLIGESAELASLCAEWRGADFITVDTEFMRESTYRAKLCLVQIGPPESEPVAVGSSSRAGSTSRRCTTFWFVRRSSRSFTRRVRMSKCCCRSPAVCRTPSSTLRSPRWCAASANRSATRRWWRSSRAGRIDKTQRFTDWARRPLTELQLRYALSDVSHLRVVYEKLAAELERTGRHSWLDEELAVITGRATYEAPPEEAWRRLKVRGNNRRFLRDPARARGMA